jgi:uncharacterized protein (DUF305 family)
MWRNLSPRGRIAAGVVLAILVAAIGYTAGLLTPRNDTPGEGSAEVGFARDMSAHHAQAVEMGMIAYQHASTADVRTLGGDIAITQQGQIGMMQTWLKDWGVGPNGTEPPMAWMPDGQRGLNGNLMPGMATREEVAKLKAATGKDADILFLQYMIRHHLGGIHMVDGVLAENPAPQVKELAQTMKNNQSTEVNVMKTMLSNLGAQPLS